VEELAIAVQMRIPTILWGSPGVGKTQSIYQLGRALGLHTEVIIASIHDPSDFSGLPIPDDHQVWYAPPDWAKRLAEAKHGLAFFDELSVCPPSVQAALLRPVLEGVVGSLKLPDTVARVAAATPPEEAAGGWNLTPPMANRFCHFDWTVNSESWISGFLSDWPDPAIKRVPDTVGADIVAAKALVASFIRVRPSLLFNFPKDEASQARAWCSPRTWEFASKLLGACNSVGSSEELSVALIAGCVGNGAAHEFWTWQKSLDLPQPEEVLKDPKGWDFPDRDDKVFAVISSTVAYACSKMSPKMWEKAWAVIERTVKEKRPDIAAVCARQLSKAGKKGYPLPDGIESLLPILKMAGRL